MQKILLVAINSKYTHTNLALLYLEKLTPDSFNLVLKEFIISQTVYDILSDINREDPDVVAISVYIWNRELVEKLVDDLKKILPGVKIILGGPEVSYNSNEWLESHSAIDYIITGGGERGWIELLESNFNLEERVISLDNLPLNEIPFPYTNEQLQLFRKRIVYYEASRGCPYKCSFCLSSRNDILLERRDIDKVKAELLQFIDQGVPLVKFVDRTFNADRYFAREIWQFLLDRAADTRFHFEINPVLLEAEDIDLLSAFPENLFQFEIGVQTTNPQTLREIGRFGYWSEIKGKIELLITNTKIPVHLDLIFGLPEEDLLSVEQSFNEIYALRPNHFQPGMLKVLPGTKMADKCLEYELEFQSTPPYRILKNRWITFSELHLLHNLEHLVNNLYNSGGFQYSLQLLESLFPSPFAMFITLEKLWQEKEVNHWLKDWAKTAVILIDFVETKRPEKLSVFKDYLRYDLVCYTNLKHYPDFLMTDNLAKLQKEWRGFLRKEKSSINNDSGLSYDSLKKAIVFQAENKEFALRTNVPLSKCIAIYPKPSGEKARLEIDYKQIAES